MLVTNKQSTRSQVIQNKVSQKHLLVISLSTLMTSLAVSSTNIVLPFLVHEFETSFSLIQWLTVGYMVSLSASLLIVGKLGDSVGHRKVYLVGLTVFVTSSTFAALSNNFELLFFTRLAQGIGSGMLIVSSMALITELANDHKVGSGIGLIAGMSAAGTGLGPVMGGFITEYLSWEYLFWINIPLGLINFWLATRHIHKPKKRNIKKRYGGINFIEAISLVFSIVSYTLLVKTTDQISIYTLAILVPLCLSLTVFAVSQKKSKRPLISLNINKNHCASVHLLSIFIVSTVIMTSLVVGPFYLIHGLNLNFDTAGLVMASSPVVVAVTAPTVGRFVRKNYMNAFSLIGLVTLLVGTILMALLKINSGVLGYCFNIVIMAAGYGIFLTSNNTLLMQTAQKSEQGKVSGLINLARNIGLLTGASIMSAIFSFSTNQQSVSQAESVVIQRGLNDSYAIASILILIILILRLVLAKRRQYFYSSP